MLIDAIKFVSCVHQEDHPIVIFVSNHSADSLVHCTDYLLLLPFLTINLWYPCLFTTIKKIQLPFQIRIRHIRVGISDYYNRSTHIISKINPLSKLSSAFGKNYSPAIGVTCFLINFLEFLDVLHVFIALLLIKWFFSNLIRWEDSFHLGHPLSWRDDHKNSTWCTLANVYYSFHWPFCINRNILLILSCCIIGLISLVLRHKNC